jgi:hypothetical protein
VEQVNKIESEDKEHQSIVDLHFGETEEDVRLGCKNTWTVRISGSSQKIEKSQAHRLSGPPVRPTGSTLTGWPFGLLERQVETD